MGFAGCLLSFFPGGKHQSWSHVWSQVDVITQDCDAESWEHTSCYCLLFGLRPCAETSCIPSDTILWLSCVGAWFWFLYVCV